MGLVVTNLVWTDFDLDVPLACPISQPKQNEAISGTPTIIVNPTQFRNHQPLPVCVVKSHVNLVELITSLNSIPHHGPEAQSNPGRAPPVWLWPPDTPRTLSASRR